MDKTSFINPKHPMQRRYEALRASIVDGLSNQEVAEKFNYTLYSFKSLKRDAKQLTAEDIFRELKRGPKAAQQKTHEAKGRIIQLRKRNYSVEEIQEKLQHESISVSQTLIISILKKEGFTKLFRRTYRERLERRQQEINYAEISDISRFGEKTEFSTIHGGIFLFLPIILQLRIPELFSSINFYGSKMIPSLCYCMSYLGLKLLGQKRLCHIDDFSFDYGLGLFAGLNVMPKSSAISSYSYRHPAEYIRKLLKGFTKVLHQQGYIRGNAINLDFHSIPHYGEESVLENHWVPTRSKVMKSVLSFFAQDLDTTFLCYSNGNIDKRKQNDEVLEFAKFYQDSSGLLPERLIFDSKLTTYANLNNLNKQGILFITLKRRGKNFLQQIGKVENWETVQIDNIKRQYRRLHVSESYISLRDYEGKVRQLIVKGTGRELPMDIITNDFKSSKKQIITFYTHRWRVENNIQENVDFFNLNALSSPVVVKVDFDIAMMLIGNTLYKLFAQQTKWFKNAKPSTISKKFINIKTHIKIDNDLVTVRFAKKSEMPYLMDWINSLKNVRIPWWDNRMLVFEFEQ
jgi:transposase